MILCKERYYFRNNEKQVGKLMKNLSLLDTISQNLSSRLEREAEDLGKRK